MDWRSYLDNTLADCSLVGLAGLVYRGKSKICYSTEDGNRVHIALDFLHMFDRAVTTIPFEGATATALAVAAFKATEDICPNHFVAMPDSNVVICKPLQMIPLEVVVRGYLSGTTATSILTMYQAGERHMYGIDFLDGMQPFQKLDRPAVTPTTKGAIDRPIKPAEIILQGILTDDQWEEVCDTACRLFARGQESAARAGLILSDTKYEFGICQDGKIVLGDEVHTLLQSRYWFKHDYNDAFREGRMPKSLDREASGIRPYLLAHKDFNAFKQGLVAEIQIPDGLRIKAAGLDLELYRRLMGKDFSMPPPGEDIAVRIQRNLAQAGLIPAPRGGVPFRVQPTHAPML
jgi:phosphoribosylaminoimidazole-succinocarboxamide synthase